MKPNIEIDKLNPLYGVDIKPMTTYQPLNFFRKDNPYYKVDFDVILDNGIMLQRDYVWNLTQKQDLIIGMLCGITLPCFYAVLYDNDISEKREQTFRIIDGKQRLSTIRDFINGEFGIPYGDDLYFFDDLTESQRYVINTYSLDFKIVYEYPDSLLGDNAYITFFNFVNFAGTPQEIEHKEKLKKLLNEKSK